MQFYFIINLVVIFYIIEDKNYLKLKNINQIIKIKKEYTVIVTVIPPQKLQSEDNFLWGGNYVKKI